MERGKNIAAADALPLPCAAADASLSLSLVRRGLSSLVPVLSPSPPPPLPLASLPQQIRRPLVDPAVVAASAAMVVARAVPTAVRVKFLEVM